MKCLKTYSGNIKNIENKINLLYKSEISKNIDITDLKISLTKDEATAMVALNIKDGERFIDCSHITVLKLEKLKRSRVLSFLIDDGREFKLVMSSRFSFANTTGLYYKNNKVGNLNFKNRLTLSNLKNIVIDFLNSTGILISVSELKESLKSEKKEWKSEFSNLVY